ncbi:MAG: hypothetical protein V8T86_15710 [Victivallis sp.]
MKVLVIGSAFFPRIAAVLKQVPECPPLFFEAVQSLWLFWTFQRLAGNWSGRGIERIRLRPSRRRSRSRAARPRKPAKFWPASGSRAPERITAAGLPAATRSSIRM